MPVHGVLSNRGRERGEELDWEEKGTRTKANEKAWDRHDMSQQEADWKEKKVSSREMPKVWDKEGKGQREKGRIM